MRAGSAWSVNAWVCLPREALKESYTCAAMLSPRDGETFLRRPTIYRIQLLQPESAYSANWTYYSRIKQAVTDVQ